MGVEDDVSAMLDCQQQVIAKASLAGCAFTSYMDSRRVMMDDANGRKRGMWVDFPRYNVTLPDGRAGTGFLDQYEAACWAVATLEKVERPDDGAFALHPENRE